MWYFQALGAAIGLALLADIRANKELPEFKDDKTRRRDLIDADTGEWRYHHDAMAQDLWLHCLLHAQLIRSAERPQIGLLALAEAAYGAAWAGLEVWRPEQEHLQRLNSLLERNASFLQNIKTERAGVAITDLRERLRTLKVRGAGRPAVWAWTVGSWLLETCDVEEELPYTEVAELGWPLASLGLGYWKKEAVFYRRGNRLFKLIQPYEKRYAFELLGPFDAPAEAPSFSDLQRVTFGSIRPTKGLRSPPIWKNEAFLGSIPGVVVTQVGYVHRQFAGEDLPEWFEAVDVSFDPERTDFEKMLVSFWDKFATSEDLLFFHQPSQEKVVRKAWKRWRASKQEWCFPGELTLKPAAWFEPATPEAQKKHLRSSKPLAEAFADFDLTGSSLATKVNSFAAGFGKDQDVVMVAARCGLDDKLTYALRTMRHFGSDS
jgi:peptide methionine sulfoxide reductase MsrA